MLISCSDRVLGDPNRLYCKSQEGGATATLAHNIHSPNRVSHRAPLALYGFHIISPVSAREVDTTDSDSLGLPSAPGSYP